MFSIKLCDSYDYLPQVNERKNFYKADFIKIGMKLSDIDWDNEFSGNNFDVKVDKFYDIIDDIINNKELVPEHKVVQTSYPEWFSYELIQNIIQKRNCTGFGYNQMLKMTLLHSRSKELFALDYQDWILINSLIKLKEKLQVILNHSGIMLTSYLNQTLFRILCF